MVIIIIAMGIWEKVIFRDFSIVHGQIQPFAVDEGDADGAPVGAAFCVGMVFYQKIRTTERGRLYNLSYIIIIKVDKICKLAHNCKICSLCNSCTGFNIISIESC